MTEPFLRDLKTQLITGRQRLLRRRRTIGAAVAALVVAGTAAGLLATVDRSHDPVEVVTGGSTTESTSGGSGVPSTTTAPLSTLPPEPPFDPWQTNQAEGTVRSFLTSLTDGADAEAAGLLSDYAVVTGGDETSGEAVERFRTEHAWLLSPVVLQTTVTPSFSFGDPTPVVTVIGRSADGEVEHAIAFVVARDEDDDVSTLPLIVRLPGPLADATPPSGSTVSPGETVALPGLPLEGGATAYIDGTEVPIDVDYEAQETTVTVPDLRGGDFVLTVSLATPEEPTAQVIWFKINQD